MGNEQHGLLGCVGCFLVPACVDHPTVGGGCGCVFWVGHKNVLASEHTVGFTFNTCWAISLQLLMPDGLSGASGCVVCCL